MGGVSWTYVLGLYIPLVVSLSIHEWAHAITARMLGDPTAEEHGRLTLNPLPHLDLIGTVVLPLMILFSHSPFLFGWAKPVPVDPTRFRRGVKIFPGMLLVSLAGPFSNLVLAFLFAFSLKLCDRFSWGSDALIQGLYMGLVLNVLLAIFNLMPVPPLDGHRLLPPSVQRKLLPFSGVIFILFLVAIWRYQGILGVPVEFFTRGILRLVGLVV